MKHFYGIHTTDRTRPSRSRSFQPCGVLGGALPIGTYPGGNQAVRCPATAVWPPYSRLSLDKGKTHGYRLAIGICRILSIPLTFGFVYILPTILLYYSSFGPLRHQSRIFLTSPWPSSSYMILSCRVELSNRFRTTTSAHSSSTTVTSGLPTTRCS